MMTDTASQDRLASSPDFAFIYAFLATFQPILGIDSMEPEDLEKMLNSSLCHDATMNTLMLSLVGYSLNRKAPINVDKWSKFCNSIINKVENVVGFDIPKDATESIEGFFALDPRIKVDIIKYLCECILSSNDFLLKTVDEYISTKKSKKDENTYNPDIIRLEPFAVDSKRRQYWVLGSETCFMYRETDPLSSKSKWELAATDISEYQAISEELRRTRKKENKLIAGSIDKDIIPKIERFIKRREKREKAFRRNLDLLANVEIRETRTRKRKQVNYNMDDQFFDDDDAYVY